MKRSKHGGNAPKKQQKLSFAPAACPISTVGEAIKCLTDEKNAGSGKERIIHSLLIVENASSSHGFSSENTIALVDIIGSQKFSLQINMRLMKCLLAKKENVPEDSLISAVSWICTQKLNLKLQDSLTRMSGSSPFNIGVLSVLRFCLQIGLLKWIIQVYDATEQKQNFTYLYGVIFDLMQYDTLAPFVSHLLCKMTEKHHVAPFRVRYLLEILSRWGTQPHIIDLLNVFSYHRKDVLTTQFKDKSFSRSIGALPLLLEKQPGGHQLEKKNHRKKETGIREMIHEQIHTCSQLFKAAQSLNTPRDLRNLLTSPKRRILFTSGLSTELLSQFGLWLRHSLTLEKPLKKTSLSGKRGDLLKLASDISEELQEGIPEVESFVKAYLTRWNGYSHLGLLLDVIQYWKFCRFEDLLEDVLLPMFKCFQASSVPYKCSVLDCYTKLYQRWVLWEVQRHEVRRDVTKNGLNLGYRQTTVFEQDLRIEDPYHEVQSLASYIDNMCIVALQLHPEHPPALLYQIMKFFEMVIRTHAVNCAAPLVLPSPFIICAAALASNVAAVSQLCSLIISYKSAVEVLRARNVEPIQQPLINTLNGCLLDICNALWRCRAFHPIKGSLLFHKELPLHIRQSVSGVSGSFSLYQHPAFYGLALDFVQKSQVALPELHNDEITREAYLTHLSNSGLETIISFIRIFIRPRASKGDVSSKSE